MISITSWMSKVVAIAGNPVIKQKSFENIDLLIRDLGPWLAMVRSELRDTPFGIDFAPWIRRLIQNKINPSIENIKKIQVQIGILRRIKFAEKEVEDVSDLVDNLLIDLAITKHKLEEVKSRVLATAQVHILVKKNMNPILQKYRQIKKKLENLAK